MGFFPSTDFSFYKGQPSGPGILVEDSVHIYSKIHLLDLWIL